MAAAGAVFLPAGGYRSGTTVPDLAARTFGCYYWYNEPDPDNSNKAFSLLCNENGVGEDGLDYKKSMTRDGGLSVRLILQLD